MARHTLDSFFDGSLGGNDTTKEVPHLWATIIGVVFSFLAKLLFRYEVVNQQVLDQFQGKKNGVVLVGPHTSYVDAVAMWLTARPRKWVRLMGKENLFSVPVLGWLICRVGAFPVARDSADTTAIKRAARMLKNGEYVGLFPEGTRRGKGNVDSSLHGGVALIARMGKAPIIPLGLVGCDQVKREGERLRFPKIKAVLGTPVSLSSFDFLPKTERLEGCTWYVMREAFALTRGCAPEEVDMVELFPETKDYADVFAEHVIEPVDVAALPDYAPAD